MKERSLAERIVAILGVLVGTIVWVVRLLFSMLQGAVKNVIGSGQTTEEASEDSATTRVADNVTQFAAAARARGESVIDDAKQRVDSLVHSESEGSGTTGVPADIEHDGVFTPSPIDSPTPGITHAQHEDIGGIPETPDMGGGVADISTGGITRPLEAQGFDEETGARLSHGIPNLEEPGGDEELGHSEAGDLLNSDAPVSDYAGYATSESDIGVDRSSQLSDLADTPDNDLQGGIDTYDTIDAGDTGSDEDQAAIDEGHEPHIPAAGRGWQEPEDPLAGDPLYGDVDSSGAGGEVDLRNDEADDETGSGMHVVDSPDEPFIEDEPIVQEMDFVDTARGTDLDASIGEIDDVTNLDAAAVDESTFASDALGNRIGGDAASGDLGEDQSFDDTMRDPGESVDDYDMMGVRAGSGVDPFASDAIAENMLSDLETGAGDTVAEIDETAQRDSGDAGQDQGEGTGTDSVAWATSAGVVDQDLTMPESPEDLQTGSDMTQAEAERIIDGDEGPGAPGSRKELQGEFMVDGTDSEAVKSPQVEEPQDAALRDVAAEMAEDIEVDAPEETDEIPGDSGHEVRERGSGSVDTNAGQGQGHLQGQAPVGRNEGRASRSPEGSVRGDGTANCPVDYPIKGNAKSRIYHRPTDPSYDNTIPEFCFATEADAKAAGFRARKL